MKIRSFLFIIASIVVLFSGCKYSDDWLNPETEFKPMVYFASSLDYTRTIIPGEGLQFGIAPSLAYVVNNKEDRAVGLKIIKDEVNISDNRILLPDNYYNSSELAGDIKVTIPKGAHWGYFYVKLDSTNFLNDPKAIIKYNSNGSVNNNAEHYALPVKIVDTSVDSISSDRNSVLIAIRYQASFDGWYLHESTIESEHGGQIIPGKTRTEKSFAEGDNITWRLTTGGPFTVRAAPAATNSFLTGLLFDLTVDGSSVSYGAQIAGQPLVEPIAGKANSYDWKTREFQLNYKYVKPDNNDTIYHVATKLIFRNRLVDGINHPREHLVY